ncbi:MAG: hypothetical protein QXR62_05390 [Candidatus Bathyarchaeia archaeon]
MISGSYAIDLISDGERTVSILTCPESLRTSIAVSFNASAPPLEEVLYSPISDSLSLWRDARDTFKNGMSSILSHIRRGNCYILEGTKFTRFHNAEHIQYSPIFSSIVETLTEKGGLFRITVTPHGEYSRKRIKQIEEMAMSKKHRDANAKKVVEAKMMEDKIRSMQFGVSIYGICDAKVLEAARGIATSEKDIKLKTAPQLGEYIKKSEDFKDFDEKTIGRVSFVMDPKELVLLLPFLFTNIKLVKIPSPPEGRLPKGPITLGYTYTTEGIGRIGCELDGFAAGAMIEGLPGSGKTVMGLRLLPLFYENGANIVVIDPKMSFADNVPGVLAQYLKEKGYSDKEIVITLLKDLIYMPVDEVVGNLNFFSPVYQKYEDIDNLCEWYSRKIPKVFNVDTHEGALVFQNMVLAALKLAFLKYQHPNIVDFANALEAIANLSDKSVISTPDETINKLVLSIRSHWKDEEEARKYASPFISSVREFVAEKPVIQSFVSRDPISLDELFGTVDDTYSPRNKILVVRIQPRTSEDAASKLTRMVFLMVQRWMETLSQRAARERKQFRPTIIIVDEAHRVVNKLAQEIETLCAEGRGLGMWPILLFQTRYQITDRGEFDLRRVLSSIVAMRMTGETQTTPEMTELPYPYSHIVTRYLYKYWFVYMIPSRVAGERITVVGYPGPVPPEYKLFSISNEKFRELLLKNRNSVKYFSSEAELMENLKGIEINEPFFREQITRLSKVEVARLVARAILEKREFVEVDRINAKNVEAFIKNVNWYIPLVKVKVRVKTT